MTFLHLETVFKCHRCQTVRENLNVDTAHVCGCHNSGPMWKEVRRSRANWALILAVLLFGATAYAVVDEVRFWGEQVSEWERGDVRPGRKHLAKLAEVLGLEIADLLPRIQPDLGANQ